MSHDSVQCDTRATTRLLYSTYKMYKQKWAKWQSGNAHWDLKWPENSTKNAQFGGQSLPQVFEFSWKIIFSQIRFFFHLFSSMCGCQKLPIFSIRYVQSRKKAKYFTWARYNEAHQHTFYVTLPRNTYMYSLTQNTTATQTHRTAPDKSRAESVTTNLSDSLSTSLSQEEGPFFGQTRPDAAPRGILWSL